MKLIFMLIFGHYLGDFGLQNDFIATHKARSSGSPFWPHVLFAHAMMHGGIVCLATGSVWLGIIEVFLHALIDFFKCENAFNFNVDQYLHIACKIAYFLFML